MPPRTCTVTATDARGVRHSVEVTAESLFEAAALAVDALRRSSLIEQPPGPGTKLEVEVREPSVKHIVTVAQVHRWVSEGGRSPADRVKRIGCENSLGICGTYATEHTGLHRNSEPVFGRRTAGVITLLGGDVRHGPTWTAVHPVRAVVEACR
jgi:hypothetical protein